MILPLNPLPPRNAMLYWNNSPAPPSVLSVAERWAEICPDWSVELFFKESATEFVRAHYGAEIASDFAACRIPAMQSDIFRVLWALQSGGVYLDLTFAPKKEPLFHMEGTDLTLVRWHHGRIINGIFSALPNTDSLQIVAREILGTLTARKQGNIWELTGPGAWIRCLGGEASDAVGIISKNDIFTAYLESSSYDASTRGTPAHWSELQKTEPLYLP